MDLLTDNTDLNEEIKSKLKRERKLFNFKLNNPELKGFHRRKKRKKKKKLFNREYKRVPKQYKVYIKSKWWEKRKNQYFKIYGRKCQICGSSSYIQVHHIVYKDLGFEEDADLAGLCQSHHEQFHSIYGVKKDMTKDFTEFFVDEKIRCEIEKGCKK